MRVLIAALAVLTVWTYSTVYTALLLGWGYVAAEALVRVTLWGRRHFRVVKRA